jgi:hypothetical protein
MLLPLVTAVLPFQAEGVDRHRVMFGRPSFAPSFSPSLTPHPSSTFGPSFIPTVTLAPSNIPTARPTFQGANEGTSGWVSATATPTTLAFVGLILAGAIFIRDGRREHRWVPQLLFQLRFNGVILISTHIFSENDSTTSPRKNRKHYGHLDATRSFQ